MNFFKFNGFSLKVKFPDNYHVPLFKSIGYHFEFVDNESVPHQINDLPPFVTIIKNIFNIIYTYLYQFDHKYHFAATFNNTVVRNWNELNLLQTHNRRKILYNI